MKANVKKEAMKLFADFLAQNEKAWPEQTTPPRTRSKKSKPKKMVAKKKVKSIKKTKTAKKKIVKKRVRKPYKHLKITGDTLAERLQCIPRQYGHKRAMKLAVKDW